MEYGNAAAQSYVPTLGHRQFLPVNINQSAVADRFCTQRVGL